MSTTNLKSQTQARIDALNGTQTRTELLKLQVIADKMDLDTTAIEYQMGVLDSQVTSATTDTELLKAAVVQQTKQSVTDAVLEALGVTKMNKPYDWYFPANAVEINEADSIVGGKSFGAHGSTWWTGDTVVCTKVNGKDVVYIGGTYESIEDRYSTDSSKQKGEAVIAVSRLEFDAGNRDDYNSYDEWRDNSYIKLTKYGVNDNAVEYGTDEHHQPGFILNKTNNQKIVYWGSRNSAEGTNPINGKPNTQNLHIRYGSDIDTLSTSVVSYTPETNNYGQGFFTGNTGYIFTRSNVGDWYYSSAPSGQGWLNGSQFSASTDQYYFKFDYIDHSLAGYDTGEYRDLLHVFGQSHPTINPDRTIRYARGTFYVAGSIPTVSSKNSGGIFFITPSDGASLPNGGKLGDMPPLDKTDFETAYICDEGRTVRVLAVQTGDIPRALVGVYNNNWVHGASVPLDTTWDLKQLSWSPQTKSWTVLDLANGIYGMLGYRPEQAAYDENGATLDPVTQGSEGYTSGYLHGAEYWSGKNHLDLEPVVFYGARVGRDRTKHSLRIITLSDDYTSVVSDEAIIGNSSEVMYRPKMSRFGDKRILTYAAGRWSTYNSWVSDGRFIDMTKENLGIPSVAMQPANISGEDGSTQTIVFEPVSKGGNRLDYTWWYKNAGDSIFIKASPTTPQFSVTVNATSNGRQYYCELTDTVTGNSIVTNTITVTVV